MHMKSKTGIWLSLHRLDVHKQRFLLQRILQVEYEFPPHVKVSKECRDLLHRILVPDPAKRITVPEIQNHVWYKKDLPPGGAEMNDNLPPPGAGLQVSLTLNDVKGTACVTI